MRGRTSKVISWLNMHPQTACRSSMCVDFVAAWATDKTKQASTRRTHKVATGRDKVNNQRFPVAHNDKIEGKINKDKNK